MLNTAIVKTSAASHALPSDSTAALSCAAACETACIKSDVRPTYTARSCASTSASATAASARMGTSANEAKRMLIVTADVGSPVTFSAGLSCVKVTRASAAPPASAP
jgi:hypothetical protein